MSATPGRKEVLEAAFDLVRRDGPAALSIAAAAHAARISYEQFRSLFADDETFGEALHQHYLDTVLGRLATAVATLPAGPRRMRAAVSVFLNVSLRHARVRTAIASLRTTGRLAATMEQRHRAFNHLIAAEMAKSGWARPVESARLLRVMIEEVARAELQALRELPELRDALWAFLQQAQPATAQADKRDQKAA